MKSAGLASGIVGGSFVVFFLTPYAAPVLASLAGSATMGIPIVGAYLTAERLLPIFQGMTSAVAVLNIIFQLSDFTLYFMGQKELCAPTGDKIYDTAKGLTEFAAAQIAFFAAMNPQLWEDAANYLSGNGPVSSVDIQGVIDYVESMDEGGSGSLPQGISQEQFDEASKLLRDSVGDISDDIVVQGSRASGTAKPTSDIDIAIKVTPEEFDELINQYFKTPNPGSAKERTMLHAIETGKIQAGEAQLSGLRKLLQEIFGMDVDVSIIREGGMFDNPPFIPFK